jgi:hypothetical protein
MEVQFKVVDLTLVPAFRDWGIQRELRGKGIADTASKVMRWWVESALEEIPAGDRSKVETYLRTKITEYSSLKAMAARGKAPTTKAGLRKVERANALRGTIAARIVAALNIYQSRGMKFEQFYANVNKWMQRRIFSVNLHRAGLLPARRTLRLRDRKGNMPRIKNLPGQYSERITDQVVSLMVENWAASRDGDGIVKLAGSAFHRGLAQVGIRIAGYVAEGVAKAARRVGFKVGAAAG